MVEVQKQYLFFLEKKKNVVQVLLLQIIAQLFVSPL